MSHFLINNALKNIWCNPEMDNQHIISPCRISQPVGVLNFISVAMRVIPLPTKGEIYHVFQIGQLSPLMIGLFEVHPIWATEQWVPLSVSMTQQKMIVDVYTDLGIQIPRFEIFYMFNNDHDLIFAIKENKKIPINYQTEKFYLRVYTNAYFNTIRAELNVEGTHCYGRHVNTLTEILEVQNLYNSYKVKTGLTYCFVNGYFVDQIDIFTVNVGDVVEFVYDSSVLRTVKFRVGDLPYFTSELDLKQKYLLHYTGNNGDTIDYHDDIDFFLLEQYPVGRYRGVYYHKNSIDAVRMLTHRDYSLTVPYLVHLAEQIQTVAGDRVIDTQQLVIQLNIRKSGYLRPLVFENNRIQELYKLPADKILPAMIGDNALVDVWKATNLEQCGYTRIMRSLGNEVNDPLVKSALGYNAASVLLGSTPSRPYINANRLVVDVPYGLSVKATAYEYDIDGLLIGYYPVSNTRTYLCQNTNCDLVELISGIGDQTPDVRFGRNDVPVPTADEYRVYRCRFTATGPDNHWEDVTNSQLYSVMDGKVVWSSLDPNPFIMVRSDAKFIAHDISLPSFENNFKVLLTEIVDTGDGLLEMAMKVPMGELDVFLNNHPLIENVDYFVSFPELTIVNKIFLKTPTYLNNQDIHIRFTGFCKKDLSREVSLDQGWIRHGLLSENTKYDLRDDKVLRIVAGGRLYHRDQLAFAETSGNLGITNVMNGRPYQIRDIVVPLKDNIDADTYDFRALSKLTDNEISAYLSLLLPEVAKPPISAITNKYEIVSPFIACMIFVLASGTLSSSAVEAATTKSEVIQLCKPYEFWLKMDPIAFKDQLDFRFIAIHPTNQYVTTPLKFAQYYFLKRVVDIYAAGLVDISAFITLAPADS